MRAQESQKLLNWGFQFFEAVKLYGGGEAVKTLEVWKGAANKLKAGFKNDLVITLPKGEAEKLKAELVSQPALVAPISQGERVGVLRVSLDGKPLGEYPLVALETIGRAGIFGRAWDTLRLWLK
jgi:serine-type D-Ala-D-Ala carboxypeptidase (penicillin-binding protein 5/6)